MKKIFCLIAVLLLFISVSFASGEKEFLDYIQKTYADFNIQQTEYRNNSSDKAEGEKEVAFLKLYQNYLNYFRKIVWYYDGHPQIDIDYKFTKENKSEYKKYGIGFNISEGSWYITEDYTMLMNTPGIPPVWLKWLTLQQKYSVKNEEACIKAFFKHRTFEGKTMTFKEMAQAIIDLENVEKQSDVITSVKTKDYSYIPYTSFDILLDYLLGNDLKPVYDRDENFRYSKLNKEARKSYEYFIKHYKNSKYYPIVEQYYTKLKNNNFDSSDDISLWVFSELQNIREF